MEYLESLYGMPYAELVRRGIVGRTDDTTSDATMRDGVSTLQF
jgi:hypothetical protein